MRNSQGEPRAAARYDGGMSEAGRFKVIDGGSSPLPGTRRRTKGEAVLLLCRTCEVDTGTATSTWIAATTGLMERAGRPEGGLKGQICAHCMARGKVTFAI